MNGIHLRGVMVTALCATALSLGCEEPGTLTGLDGSGGSGNDPGTPTSTKAPTTGPLTGGIVTGSASPTAAPGATSSVTPVPGSSGSTVVATPTPTPTATPTPTPVDARPFINSLGVMIANHPLEETPAPGTSGPVLPTIYVGPPAGREGDALYPFRAVATISVALLSNGSTYRGPFIYSAFPSGIVTVTARSDHGADLRALSYATDTTRDVVISVLASDSVQIQNSLIATCSLRVRPVSGAIVTVK
jgi:hypothetical protein